MEQNFTVSLVPEGGKRMFCGPTVLALLSGKTREEIHADVNRLKRKAGKKRNKLVRGRDGRPNYWKRIPWPLTAPVKGMGNNTLEKLLKKYGISNKRHDEKYPSLARLVEDMGHFKMPIIVNVTDHYVLYFQGNIYDTLRPSGAHIDAHPSKGRRVKKYWIITRQKIQKEAPCFTQN